MPLVLDFVLFLLEFVYLLVSWCYKAYRNGEYSTYPKGKPSGAYIR